MSELAELQTFFRDAESFQDTETKTVRHAYRFALSYVEEASLVAADRRCLALLIIATAAARRRRGEGLTSIVDAHALAAEIIEPFLLLKTL